MSNWRSGPSQIEYLNIEDIPGNVRATVVSKYFIQILDLDFNGPLIPNKPRLNHCTARLIFENDIPNDSEVFPGAKQVYIDLEFYGEFEFKTVRGLLNVKPHWNTNPSPRSVKNFEISVAAGATVEDFLSVLDKHHMVPCGFNTQNSDAKGCKDFTSQFTYRLIQEGVLNVPADGLFELFQTFNPNYGPGELSRPGTVGYAAFNAQYHERHMKINGIEYSGDRISRDSAEGRAIEYEPANIEIQRQG
ncbi:uncharacterized protein N7483_003488 [Penicillium malachiteum]|uniref:uncharacterized protein n=1 Tax=Penicillium malachiteum TaxID=1324776 RepID=UPI002549A76C|nr:uncharacterized protein N7483_003488 [Penicillium malachiteum]KAJ5728980.1 hypothetical protein N7483_003488 [Penicillium malachiteum]